MYISLANSLDHCTQGGTGDGGDSSCHTMVLTVQSPSPMQLLSHHCCSCHTMVLTMPSPSLMWLLHHCQCSCYVIAIAVVFASSLLLLSASLWSWLSHHCVVAVIASLSSSLSQLHHLHGDFSYHCCWTMVREGKGKAKAAYAELDSWFKSSVFGNGH